MSLNKYILNYCLVLSICFLLVPFALVSQCDVCNYLIDNVVQITTTFENEDDENGFGFIVSEDEQYLYIVTANHVIQSQYGSKTLSINVSFFKEQFKSYSATAIKFNDDFDIGLIQVEKTKEIQWQNDCIDLNVSEGDKIWYIGRSQAWYVPVTNGYVNSYSQATNKLIIEMPGIQKGCSGAPVISENGIIGIITHDSPGDVSGIHIEFIRDLVQGDWNIPFQLNPLKSTGNRNTSKDKTKDVFPISRFALSINPLGFLQFGPVVNFDIGLTKRLILNLHARFPSLGLLSYRISELYGYTLNELTGYAFGVGSMYFFKNTRNKPYAGLVIDYNNHNCLYDKGEATEYSEITNSYVLLFNGGYRLRFESGMMINIGAFLGPGFSTTDWKYMNDPTEPSSGVSTSVGIYGMVEFSIGYEF